MRRLCANAPPGDGALRPLPSRDRRGPECHIPSPIGRMPKGIDAFSISSNGERGKVLALSFAILNELLLWGESAPRDPNDKFDGATRSRVPNPVNAVATGEEEVKTLPDAGRTPLVSAQEADNWKGAGGRRFAAENRAIAASFASNRRNDDEALRSEIHFFAVTGDS